MRQSVDMYFPSILVAVAPVPEPLPLATKLAGGVAVPQIHTMPPAELYPGINPSVPPAIATFALLPKVTVTTPLLPTATEVT